MKALSLSPRTKQLIGNMAKINEGLVFRPGHAQYTWTPHKGSKEGPAIYTMAKFAETVPIKFGIANLSKFLNILGQYDEPKISFKEDLIMYIVGKDGRSFQYVTTPLGNIHSPEGVMEIDGERKIIEFELSHTALQNVNRILAVAELNRVRFVGDGSQLVLVADHDEQGKHSITSDVYAHPLGPCEKKFDIRYKAYKIQSLMENSYNVILTEGFSQFRGPDIEYLLSPETSTTF